MKRFLLALTAYAVLGIVGALTLSGDVRLILLIFLGGLAVKTWVGYRKQLGE